MRKIVIFFIVVISLITFQSIVSAGDWITCPKCGGSGIVYEYSEDYGYTGHRCTRCDATGKIKSSDNEGSSSSGGGGVCIITPFFITILCSVFIIFYGKKRNMKNRR